MKTASVLTLLFAGLWGLAYNSNPGAFGTHFRSALAFAVLAAMVTAGFGLLTAKRGGA